MLILLFLFPFIAQAESCHLSYEFVDCPLYGQKELIKICCKKVEKQKYQNCEIESASNKKEMVPMDAPFEGVYVSRVRVPSLEIFPGEGNLGDSNLDLNKKRLCKSKKRYCVTSGVVSSASSDGTCPGEK